MLFKTLQKLLIAIAFLPFAAHAQTGLVIDGDQLYITPGCSLYVNDSLLVINGGSINNNGDTIYVTGDWTNNNSAADVFTMGSTGTVSFNGSSNQNITGTSTTTFDGILINNSAGTTLGVNTSVTGTIAFNSGLINTTSSYTLALGASGSVIGAGSGSYVNGNFQKTINTTSNPTINFEIGDASVYAPLNLALHGSSVGGAVTASTTAGQESNISTSAINSSKDVARFWTLSNNSISGFTTFDPTFNYSSGDVIGSADPSTFILQEYTGSWGGLAISGTPTSTITSGTGGTALAGDYSIGDPSLSVATNPDDTTVCDGNNVIFSSTSTSSPTPTIQWQENNGSGWADISMGGIYGDPTVSNLFLTGVNGSMSGYQYRAVFTNTYGTVNSTAATLTVNALPTVDAGSYTGPICQGATTTSLGGSFGGGATGATWDDGGAGGSFIDATDPTTDYIVAAGAPSSVTLTLTTSGGSCGTTSASTIVIVNPNPSVNAGTYSGPICQGATTDPLGGSFSGGATGATWDDGGAGGSFANASDPNTTYTASVTAPSSVILTLTTSGGSCGSTSASIAVIVNPTPTVDAGSYTGPICQGATTPALGGSFGGGATGATWDDGGANGSFSNINDPNSTYTVWASATSPVTLTLTTSGGSCGTTSASTVITVNQNPTVSAGSYIGPVCQGATTPALGGSIGGSATGATWDDGGIGGTFADATDPNTTYTAIIGSPSSVTLTLSTSGGSCGSLSASTTITVSPNPVPVITGNGSQSEFVGCGSVTLDAGAGYQNYYWTPYTGDISESYGTSSAGTYTVMVTESGTGCTGTASQSVTVYPNPTPSISGPLSFCAGGNAVLDAGSYVSYLWQDLSTTTEQYTATSGGSYSVTVTDGNGCAGSTTVTETVNPLPTPTITPLGQVPFCPGGSVVLDAGSGYSAYLWQDNSASETFTATGAATYSVTVTEPSTGCQGSTSTSVSVYSPPTASFTNPAATICSTGSGVSISGSVTASAPWTLILSDGSNVAGSYSSGFSFNLNPGTSTTYTIVSLTDATGCTSDPSSFGSEVVTVNPSPTVSAGNYTTPICQGATTPNLGGSFGGGATGATWDDGGAGGTFADVSDPNTSYTAAAGAPSNVTLTLTTSGGLCGSISASTIVPIYATPTVSSGNFTGPLCQGGTTPNLGGSIGGSASTGTWDDGGAGGSFANINDPNTTYTAAVGAPSSITLTLTTSGGSCGTTSASTTISVSPVATVDAGSYTGPICQGATTANLGGAFGGSATGAIWDDGGAGGSFANTTDPNTTYTAALGAPVSVTLTLTATGGCGTATSNTVISVSPAPFVSAGAYVGPICQGATTGALGGTFAGATGVTWDDGGAGGTFADATDPNTTYTVGAAAPSSVTLTLTTNGGLCGNSSASTSITVNPDPTVNAGSFTGPVCQGGATAALGGSFGGGATGVTWDDGGANGAFANINDPNTVYLVADNAPSSVTLTLTTIGGSCGSVNASTTITVSPGPTVDAGTFTGPICQGGSTPALGGSFGGVATGVTWDDGGAGGSFADATDPNTIYTAGAGAPPSVILTLTTNGGSCGTRSASTTITVNSGPTASISSPDAAICLGNNTSIGGSVTANGAWTITLSDGTTTATGTGNGLWNASVSPGSTTSYTILSLTDQSGCTTGATPGTETVTVNTSGPTADITGSDYEICSGLSASLSGDVTAIGNWTLTLSDGTTTTTGNGSGSWSASVSPGSTTSYTVLSLTDQSGCSSGALTGTETVTVDPVPTADINSPNVPICSGGSGTTIGGNIIALGDWTLQLNDGITTVTGTGNGSWTASVNPGSTTTYSISTLTDPSSVCSSSNLSGQVVVTVNSGPTASITSSDVSVCSGGGTNITGTVSATGAWNMALSDGITTVTGNGSGTWTAHVTPSSNTTYTIVSLSDASGCSTGALLNSETVTVNPLPSVSPSSNSPVAAGNAINLSANASGGSGNYTNYSWSGPDLYSSSGSTDSDPSIANSNTPNQGIYTVVVTDNNGCTGSGTTDVLVTGGSGGYVWSGAVSSNFSDANNWVGNAAPGSGCAVNVTIPAPSGGGQNPTISSPVSLGNVTVAGGVIITNNSTLSVCGTWAGGSSTSTVGGTGIVVISGSSAQSITGKTQFQELVINNTSGVSLGVGAAVSIYNALDLQSGNFDVSSGSITFLSTSTTQCAIIDNFSVGNSGTLSGTIHAQRYYAASSTYNEHFMGSPVNAPLLSQLGAGSTSGFVIPLADCSENIMAGNSPYGNVYALFESHGASCGMAQWYVEPGTNHATNGLGYSVRESSGAGTLTLTGTANLGSSYQLTGLTNSDWTNTTEQGRPLGSGWQLVSNPYLATIQPSTVDANIGNQVQIWNTSGLYAGSYQPGLIGEGAVIPPFQAFMVKYNDTVTPGTFTFNGGDRIRTPLNFFIQNDNQLDITAENASTGLLDKTTVAFNTNATDGFDNNFDADKIYGDLSRHTLYSMNHNRSMAINVLNSVSTTSTVPVGFEPGTGGNYSFAFNGINTFDPTSYVFLEDVQAGTMTDVRSGAYNFTSTISDNWDRFVLHFTPPAVINSVNASCTSMGLISVTQPGTANWNYQLKDNTGAVIASGMLNESSPLSVNAQAGTYTLTLIDNNNYTVTKNIVVSGAQDITASFSTPSNTATVQSEISFSSTSQNASNYSWNFGDGTIISGLANATHSYTTPGTYNVSLTVTNATGCSSSVSQTITISGIATGIGTVTSDVISMWSNAGHIYVDFTQAGKVDAVIRIFDVLGQELSKDKYTSNTVYQKTIDQIDAAYVIVSVKNDDKITTRKLFIANTQ